MEDRLNIFRSPLHYISTGLLIVFAVLGLSACNNEEKKNVSTQNVCEKEYGLYGDVVSKYKIRMEDMIEANGCGVIPVYASIIASQKFDILDAMEDDKNMMKEFIKLFSYNEKIANSVFKNPQIKNIIMSNSLQDGFMENFVYIVKKKLHRRELKKIEKDPNYLNYVLIASLYASDPKESLNLYSKLLSSISSDIMPTFVVLLSSVGKEYDFDDLLENFIVLQNKLSEENLDALISYPEYIAYFLYPSKKEMSLGVFDSFRVKKYQTHMQEMVIYLYSEITSKYRYHNDIDAVPFALKSIENIYPYLLEQYDVNIDDFKQLFHTLVTKEYIYYLFANDICSDKSQENFAVFGQNNIKNIIELNKKEKQLVHTLTAKLKHDIGGFMSFVYVANFYHTMSSKEWNIFKDLLVSLPDVGYQQKIYFLQIMEKNGYFRNIVEESDYQATIKGKKKYQYILLTPYPSDNDHSLFVRVLDKDVPMPESGLSQSLIDLMKKDKDELETHDFTNYEKGMTMNDNAEYLLAAVSIMAAPFTGGATIAIVAAIVEKRMVMLTIKKGIKRSMKNMAINTRRKIMTNKHSLKFHNKYIKSEKTKKREEIVNAFKKNVDKAGWGTITVFLVGNGAYLFMADDGGKKNTICEEKEK